ncbi:zinc-finger-containing protein [Burkholderia glumae]|uniref:zinc-finger-containing protein n=1 Tax=Burkholderia glumae TaxID=337 RepID=UPI002036C6A0|nr:zinc-finger-containing protein [Burkholderia glumae]MCM2547619.1 DUF3268 family zinc-finger domain-containing protein [Burkholderia glumae]
MSQIAEDFDRATGEKTPWNPSRRAIKRVLNPLPAPTVCRFCGGKVEIVRNSQIYHGRDYGEWPWAYLCGDCRAYVGMHPFTAIPLGTLADGPTREARKRAKAAFNPLWETGGMTRTAAYSWLAARLDIVFGECHVGWFDVAMCDRVVEVCSHYTSTQARRRAAHETATLVPRVNCPTCNRRVKEVGLANHMRDAHGEPKQ